MLVVFSAEEFLNNEGHTLNLLFEEGMENLHLRKPNCEPKDLGNLLEKIKPEFHSRIVLHQHHDLQNHFRVKGLHFKELDRRNSMNEIKMNMANGTYKNLSLSTSFHNCEDLYLDSTPWHYQFLSPVFDSISKEQYTGQKYAVDSGNKTILGLGGVHAGNMNEIKSLGYCGAAVLGAVWNTQEPLKAFRGIYEAYKVSFS